MAWLAQNVYPKRHKTKIIGRVHHLVGHAENCKGASAQHI